MPLGTSTSRRTPETLEVAIAPPVENLVHGNLRDQAILHWTGRNLGQLYLLLENNGGVQLDLGFFGSPDNGEEVPYAPVEWNVAGALATRASVVPDGLVEIVAPPTYAVAASGRVRLDAQPNDGDTVTLEDTTGTTVTFEFDDNASVGGGNTAVTIGSGLVETRDNLLDAINNSSLDVTAIPHIGDDLQIRNFGMFPRGIVSVYQNTVGSAGNIAILTNGADLSASGFTNGSDGTTLDWFSFRMLANEERASGRLRVSHWQGNLVPHYSTEEESL